jgi:hypothetical protein
MNIYQLDIDDSFNFFCPITGAQILGPDFFEPSGATVFTFSPEAGDFDSISEPYKSIWDEIEETYGDEEFGDELWERFCARLAKEHPNLLLFGFTTHGIACGPVSNTIFVAIDFACGCVDGEFTEDEEVDGD